MSDGNTTRSDYEMKEVVWLGTTLRPVVGHIGFFVSRCGRVFRKSGAGYVWVRDRAHPKGYRRVNIGPRKQTYLVHRLVSDAWLPPPEPSQIQVRHRDGDKTNNSADNLAWGTPADNEADKFDHGTACVGEKNPMCRSNRIARGLPVRPIRTPGVPRVTTEKVVGIREGWAAGVLGRELAEKFGVNESGVSSIARGKSYRHAPGPITTTYRRRGPRPKRV